MNNTWSRIIEDSKAFNVEDRVLLKNSIQQLNKSIHWCNGTVNSIANILYLANSDIRNMRPQVIEDAGVDLEDEEQMHVFEGLRRTIDRQKEKIVQGDKYREVLEAELQQVKETLTKENDSLKGKLGEVYDIQKSLKQKFDSNVECLEELQQRDADHEVELRSYKDKIQYAAEHIDALERQLEEKQKEGDDLRQTIVDTEQKFSEREQSILEKIELQAEEMRKVDTAAFEKEDLVNAQKEKIAELGIKLTETSKNLEDYKMKYEIKLKKANEADSLLEAQESRFKADMESILAKVDK